MEFTRLGRTGLKVSRLCLGTMNYGPEATEEEGHAQMDRALDEGINFFDTANVYGRSKGVGATETIIGNWFSKGDGRREKVVLATKVFGSMGDWPNENKLSALNIKRACDASLKRLQTDHIDLYQMHHVDPQTPWDEIWQAMNLLIQQGKILYVGSSNFAGWHIVQANESAKQKGMLGLVSEQCHYHLLERRVEMDVAPACAEYGLGLIPWSPLAGGLLGGALKKQNEGRRSSEAVQKRIEQKRTQLESYEKLCADIGEEPGVVALAWLLSRPQVDAPIIGPRTMDQLESALRAVDVKLDDDALSKLDEIFPGHKTSPEEFAW
ncbi:MAG TPA: aldo/keto reductase [Actinomycetota bacterium]|nr:aldo/keto reductase [Actinomycetota bacterium]